MTTWTLLLLVYVIVSLTIPLLLLYMKKWIIKKTAEYNGNLNYKLAVQILFLVPGFGTALVLLFWGGVFVRTTKKLLGYPVRDIDNL